MVRTLVIAGLVFLFFFSAFTPPMTVLSAEIIPLPVQVLGALFQAGNDRIPSQKTKAFYRQDDPSLTGPLDAIAWAVKRKDIRACSDLPRHRIATDLLMLCIATVQGDSSRCDRVGDSVLQRICHEVIAL